MIKHVLVAASLAAATVSAPALAQSTGEELTAEEIADLFAKQKTRGLVLAPTTAATTVTDTAAAATATTETTATTTATTTETSAATTETATAATTETTATVPETTVATTEAATTYHPLAAPEAINLRINFDINSSTLRDDQKSKLTTMCEVMKIADVSFFQVIGHTDASGSDALNMALSKARAEAVMGYLVNDCGIDPAKLSAVGAGESALLDPAQPNGEMNRRVEFQALG